MKTESAERNKKTDPVCNYCGRERMWCRDRFVCVCEVRDEIDLLPDYGYVEVDPDEKGDG